LTCFSHKIAKLLQDTPS